MITNGTNAANGSTAHDQQKPKFDPNFTQHVIDLMSPETKPRHRQILTSLIRHMHDFCREVELQQDEWILGVNYINSLGQAYKKNRNETWRVQAADGKVPTSSSILGPFWSPDTPFRALGASVVQDMPPDGQLTRFRGVVRDVETGRGIPSAVFDMWQASTNGKYDAHDPENQSRHNLRGKFRTDADGRFDFYCLKPTEYAIDTSGPSAELLAVMGRHPWRPAHIHVMVTHDEYIGVTAQLYPDDDPYLETDTACAVKDDLLLHFTPVENEPNGAVLEVEYDVNLLSKEYKPDSNMLMQNANQDKF
ncbi:Intradiol ring-cleavage dioxygenase, core [Cordyceps fumosorosea ARSEF 2679]|uniref:Intradiol ring-cleavage dioxygenase, core n=1 Tax=Cordyceps fumosorosea (strain ARSEF 2679) TaxID=1081104 RepID=A0A167UD25_CORFA|nr:Intradiol ring-cleavage dioxygenase, core [Cordyceps fumosorosea ARSEF 2679]OAA61464.1 Intradiol ring-cleavage dioxygenase, core [Cordyceps fumosorosea ARSEF 2679]